MNIISMQSKTAHILCGTVFCIFSFLYLYLYQADVVAAGQHILSAGRTHYDPLVGAVLITFVLLLLQIGVKAVTGLIGRFHAITYIPSALVLCFITCANDDFYHTLSIGAWKWVLPVVMIIWAAAVYIARQYQEIEREPVSAHPFTSMLWINMLQMSLILFLVGMFSNHDPQFHYRMRMENLIVHRQYADAIQVYDKAYVRDANMTMLRFYALARMHQLGEKAFGAHVIGGVAALRPDGKKVHGIILPDSIILTATRKSAPYALIGKLLKKDLSGFVHDLRRYRDLEKPLERSFREALTLYSHLEKHPTVRWENEKMEKAFRSFRQGHRQSPSYWSYYYSKE